MTPTDVFLIYIGVTLVLYAGIMILAPIVTDNDVDTDDAIGIGGFCAFWPVLLIVGTIVSPFAAIYLLSRFIIQWKRGKV